MDSDLFMEPLTHTPSTMNSEWNESYYFRFADPKTNIRGMSRIGFKINKSEGMAFLFLFFPDGSAAGYHTTEPITGYSNPFTVGEMKHECLIDKNWLYTFEGTMIVVENPRDFPKVKNKPELIAGLKNVQMNLSFQCLNDTYEYSKFMTGESLELGKKSGDEHWEQIALISGNILVDDEKYSLTNVMGQRDHTHGIRDWTGVGNWLYYVVWFNENLAINPAAIIASDGRLSTGGFIFKDGKNIPLKTIKIIEELFDEKGVYPKSSILELVDWNNEKHILKGQVGPILPIPFKDEEGESILIQAFGTFELDDIQGGYGTFETLRRCK